jgi:hypothetical protein
VSRALVPHPPGACPGADDFVGGHYPPEDRAALRRPTQETFSRLLLEPAASIASIAGLGPT